MPRCRLFALAAARAARRSPAAHRPRRRAHAPRHARGSCRTSTSPTSSRPPRPGRRTTAPTACRTRWCGDERTTDDTANAATPAPTCRSSRSSTPTPPTGPTASPAGRDALQANVAIDPALPRPPRTAARRRCASTWAPAAARSTSTSRSSSCPARARPTSTTSARSPAPSSARSAPPPARATRSCSPTASPAARRSTASARPSWAPSGERPGAAQRPQPRRLHLGRSSAATARPRPAPARWGWWPEGFLHEMTHNLGAVQWGAPHSTQPRRPAATRSYGHCWQGADVMCYVEDAGAAHAMQQDCAAHRRRDPAELRLRPRRLLQPRAGRRLLPGDALEHLRLRVPRAVRRDRARLRRRPAVGARAAGRDRRPRRSPARRAAASTADRPRRAAGRNGPTGYAYQWQRLVAGRLGEHRRRDRAHLRRRPATTSAAACASPSSPPTRTAAARRLVTRPRRSAPRASTAPPARRPSKGKAAAVKAKAARRRKAAAKKAAAKKRKQPRKQDAQGRAP